MLKNKRDIKPRNSLKLNQENKAREQHHQLIKFYMLIEVAMYYNTIKVTHFKQKRHYEATV